LQPNPLRSTLAEARKGGASHILVSKQRGRSAQMNAGAEVATGELLVFMHADTTKPPKNLPMASVHALYSYCDSNT